MLEQHGSRDEFDPVGLDLPRVEPYTRGARERGATHGEETATSQKHRESGVGGMAKYRFDAAMTPA
jgi:hypothetical protein